MTKQSTHETFITDDQESLISRKEVQQKLDQLSIYMHRVQSRLKALDKQINVIYSTDDSKKLVEEGLKAYDLSSDVSTKR